MRSRALRVTLSLLAIAALAAAAYGTWTIEMRERERRASASLFLDTLTSAQRDVSELRAAQQAYVAEGQSESYWFDRVTAASEALRSRIGELDASSPSQETRTAIGETTAALRTFEGHDRRARSYAATGQKLLASDVIYGDSLAAVTTMIGSLDSAADDAAAAGSLAASTAQQEQLLCLGGGAGFLLLALLLLTPRPGVPEASAESEPAAPAATTGLDLDLRPARASAAPSVSTASSERSAPSAASAPSARSAPPAVAAPSERSAPPSSAAPSTRTASIQAIAAVCTDLAKLSDTDGLPAILERTATTLDATGLVLWVADYAGSELVPVATHGYPASLLSRLGTIPREASNATAAAFRTGLVQTVTPTSSANGAIAAPLMTPAGCRGVLSAEVRGPAAQEPEKLAAAAIIAAQLSALVGPPAAATDDAEGVTRSASSV